MCYKENKSLFSYRYDNGQTYFIFITITISFGSRKTGNIKTCKEIRFQKLIKFGLSGWYCFGIYQIDYK